MGLQLRITSLTVHSLALGPSRQAFNSVSILKGTVLQKEEMLLDITLCLPAGVSLLLRVCFRVSWSLGDIMPVVTFQTKLS